MQVNIKVKDSIDNELIDFFTHVYQPNILNSPNFLKSFAPNCLFLISYFKSHPIMYWPFVLTETLKESYIPEFIYYLGPCYTKYFYSLLEHKKFHLRNIVVESSLSKIFEKLSVITFQSNLIEKDIRPFIWAASNKNFIIKYRAKYTAILDIANNKFVDRFRQLHKRNLIKADNENLYSRLLIKTDLTSLTPIYIDRILNRIDAKEIRDELLESFTILIDNNLLSLDNSIGVFTADHELIGFNLLISNLYSSNLLTSCVKNEYVNLGIYSLLYKLTFDNLYKNNIPSFDFNGANSFHLAYDKHGYGAYPSLYFDITIAN